MKYLIVGFSHLQGVSKKTGKPYDMYSVHCVTDLSPYNGFGKQAVNFTVDAAVVPDDLSVGDICSVFFDELKRPVLIQRVAYYDISELVF